MGLSEAQTEQRDGDWSFKLVTCHRVRSETGNAGSGDYVVFCDEPMSFGHGLKDYENHE